MSDGPNEKTNDAVVAGLRRLVYVNLAGLLAIGLLLSLPWAGVGYCVFVGSSSCPAILSPQTAQLRPPSGDDTAQTPRSTDSARRIPAAPAGRLPAQSAGNSPTANPKYVALVIGNTNYPKPNDLENPRNDAAAVAAKLKGLNYTLVGGDAQFEVGRIRFEELLLAFEEQSAKAKVALIYYAGHGVEDRGENFLIPVDAKLERRASLKAWGLPLTRVTAALPKADDQYGVIILDACRTSNFLLVDDDGKRRSVGQRGLIVQKAPGRALIAYAASAGEAAADGDGANSPYVASLLNHMSPDVDIKTVFARVQDDLRKSRWAQRPDTSDQIGDKKIAFAPEPPPPPAGTEFRDCPDCPLMVVIPKGRFKMGAPESEPGSDDSERPVRDVTMPVDFAVGVHEVTFTQWDACVAAGGCNTRPKDEGWGRGDRPVINVNWDNAKGYVRWLSEKTRKKYRLLTEAEWEYAARAGVATAFPWGHAVSHEFANFGDDECCDGKAEGRDRWGAQTAPTGSFPPNKFGLYDMLGNVAEWLEDCWSENDSGLPTDSSARVSKECAHHLLRGGSWQSPGLGLRVAKRSHLRSTIQRAHIGFRVARTF